MFRRNFYLTLSLFGLCSTAFAQAEESGGWNFAGSGFVNVTAGKMFGGTRGAVLDKSCPCFVADYAQNGIYDGRSGVQFAPDSKLGLQGTATLPDARFSLTAQAVARGAANGAVNIEWLYGTYQINESTLIQVGQKRLPMFYYSDSQDVGYAMPWTHLPPQIYGWEVVNYDGVNVQHHEQIGDWDVTANMLAGNSHVHDSGYWKVYNGQATQTHVTWNNIVGGNVTLVKDWFETRLAYIQSETQRNSNGVWNNATQSIVANTDPFMNGNITRQRIYTAAFNADLNDWRLMSEFLFIDRPGANFKDHGSELGVIRHFDGWEMGFNLSEYHAQAVVALGGDPLGQESHIDRMLNARYYLTEQSSVKAQVDMQHDLGGINWSPRYGDSKLLTLAYDRIF